MMENEGNNSLVFCFMQLKTMGKYRTFNSSSSSDSSIMDHVETYDLNSNVWTTNTDNWYRNDGKYNREEISQLGQNVKDDFSKTDYELSSSNYAPRFTVVEDLIASTTKIARNTNFKTIFIKVFHGIKIKPISVGDNPYTGFTSHIPELDEAVSDYHFYSASDFVNATIESSIDGYFCVSIGKSYSVSLSIIAEGLVKQFTLLSEDEQEVKDTLTYNITTDDTTPTTTAIVGLIPDSKWNKKKCELYNGLLPSKKRSASKVYLCILWILYCIYEECSRKR